MVEVTGWRFRAGFRHLFIGQPARSICSLAKKGLVDEMVDESPVEVPETPTCWLCLAIEDWARKRRKPLDPSAFT